jgi:amidohydrolase
VRAQSLGGRLRAHRRTIHRHPELAFAEHRTAAYVEEVLTRLGVPHRRVVGTGVVAVIEGEGPGCVGVRADMDALPVTEAPGRKGYRSEIEGVSHACGHDGHTAILLGLAELLSGFDEVPGTVVLYFQPAEEETGGALPMVRAGVLDDPVPEAILALHAASGHRSGIVGLRQGPVTGSMDTLHITIHGRGGHAAHPHLALDPVPIAAELILAAQRIVTREISPVKPALITFGQIEGGTKPNVIAPSVRIGATLRAVHAEVREHLLRRLPEVAHGVAATHRARAEVSMSHGFAPGYNDPGLAALVGEAARAVVGDDQLVWEPEPSLGAEDFFDFGTTGIPVCMFRLGVANEALGITAPHHSPDFDLDEAALPVGVAVFAESIRRLLTGEPGDRPVAPLQRATPA